MKPVTVRYLEILFRLWVIHLLFAALSIPVSIIRSYIQTVSVELAAGIAFFLGAILSVGYVVVLARVSKKYIRSLNAAVLTGVLAALPYVLVIVSAVLYLRKVPHNTIGYNFILLPVNFPFISWMDQVYPVLPFHVLALFVPLAVMAATVCGVLCGKNVEP